MCFWFLFRMPTNRKRSHHLGDDDIKVIPIKEWNVDYWEEESVITIKIIREIPSDVERGPARISLGSMNLWNFKNLNLMKVKATKKNRRYF